MRPSHASGRATRSLAGLLVCLPVCLAAATACGAAQPTGQATSTAVPSAEPSPSQPAGTSSPGGTPGPGESPPADQSPPAQPAPTGTAEVDVEREGMEPALVTGVRYATHPAYDRIVVDLKDGMPGYSVEWVDELVQDGSGKPLGVNAGAYLQITLTPANAHTQKGDPTWKGGPIFHAGLANVDSVVKTGDFEGRVGVGLALDRRAGFRVSEQRDPYRLVIDVAH
ncbi:hypothetical protein HII36_10575 [Nonomuraea sp. NN258]|uniref:AMIN-like domain-containing (lipo)protein n=1 Tax=Nonomuraea antri TaxID=2730852 RepID=UPI001568A85B|nr:hypothetical protein [Nonomuraea antri]NRQ32278.1 hypothetical protein [Nonomuraea antri]